MRAWQDTEAKRRWAATPSSSLGEDSKAASRIGVFDTGRKGDGNHSVNLSGNPKDGRTDQFAGGRDETERRRVGKLGALGNQILG